jgi:hypothetical protein
MNRRAVIVRLLLVSGAIVNIAMVWGIAMWSRGGPLKQPWETTAEEAVAIYHRHILARLRAVPDSLRIWADDASGYRLFAMMMPVAIARTTPVTINAEIATGCRSCFTSQPVAAPVSIAAGTANTLQNTPAIGQMLEFIANGTTKQVRNTHIE